MRTRQRHRSSIKGAHLVRPPSVRGRPTRSLPTEARSSRRLVLTLIEGRQQAAARRRKTLSRLAGAVLAACVYGVALAKGHSAVAAWSALAVCAGILGLCW